MAAALNPIDWKIPVYKRPFVKIFPVVLGSDTAGIVEEVGAGVTTFEKGDRVVHQGHFNNDNASFQQYVTVPAEIAAKIPDNITFEQAASLPLCLATAVEGLYGNANRSETGAKRLSPPPWEAGGDGAYKGKSFVVFGGSSSVGQYEIITTSSIHNAEFLKSLGATHVIDRKADVVAEARNILGEKSVDIIYDAISTKETQAHALDIVASGGQVISVTGVHVDKADYPGKNITTFFGSVHADNVRALGVSLYSKLTELLASEALKPNRVEVLSGGLAGIPAGLKRMQANAVSGVKLVVRPGRDTIKHASTRQKSWKGM